jgi:hypothetical protein
VHDAVNLERIGVPAAVICTMPFRGEGEAQARMLGLVEVRLAPVTHPVSTLSADELAARAAEALPLVLAAWRRQERNAQ